MAQEQRRSSGQPERRPRTSRSPRKKRGFSASFALLYVVFVIGISALLACVGWIAANDVLALNKPEKTVTVTISQEDSFGAQVESAISHAQEKLGKAGESLEKINALLAGQEVALGTLSQEYSQSDPDKVPAPVPLDLKEN